MPRCFGLILLLLVIASPAFCDDAAEQGLDIEDVPTPLTLPELLPPGGIDAVDIDFCLRIQASYKDKPVDIRFMHWIVRPVDGELVFTVYNGTAGERKYHRAAKTTFSKEGRLTRFEQVLHEQGRLVSKRVGEPVDEGLLIKTTLYDAAGDIAETDTETRSLEALETSLPSEWFPLVVAYHLRKGSLGYRFARTDLHYNFQHAETRIEDVGTEEIELGGKPATARLLLGERTFGREDDRVDAKLHYLVLPNGEMFSMRTLYHGYQFLGHRVDPDRLKDEFWLPEPGKP